MRRMVDALVLAMLGCGALLLTGCPPEPDDPGGGGGGGGGSDDPARASAVWAKKAVGPTNDAAMAVTPLPDGSAIVTGYFGSTAVFSSSTQQEVSWASAGGNDIFIAKYGPTGQLAWVTAAGSSGTDEGHGIAVLSDGSFYVTGTHSLLAAFGVRDPIQQILPSAGLLDVFLARFNADGTFRYATRAGGISNDEANDVSALDNGSAFVTGYFTDQAGFGVAEANETVLTAFDEEDIFIARYNNDGSLNWATRAGGADADVGLGIAAYSDGSSVVAGYLGGQFKAGGDTKQLARDAYIARYDGLGNRSWFRQISSSGDIAAQDVAALSGGDSLVVGNFTGTVTFGYGEPNETTLSAGATMDAFIARFTSAGALVWVKRAGSALGETQPYAVSAYGNDTFVVGGYFTGTLILGPGEAGENEVEAVAGQDLFVARFDSDGDAVTVCHGGGNGSQTVLGVSTAPGDDFMAVGAFDGPVTVGIDSLSPVSLTTSGGWDLLVSRLSE